MKTTRTEWGVTLAELIFLAALFSAGIGAVLALILR